MLRRLADDPVGQTVQFELLIPLFLLRALNVRPDTLASRGTGRPPVREWCSDGAAAASTGAGMVGPILAFRGEIEAQGRGSLHPYILVWLVCQHLQVTRELSTMLRNRKDELCSRLVTLDGCGQL